MNLERYKVANELFANNKIYSHDVAILTLLDVIEEFERQEKKRFTWEEYLEYAKKNYKYPLQNSNNVKQKASK